MFSVAGLELKLPVVGRDGGSRLASLLPRLCPSLEYMLEGLEGAEERALILPISKEAAEELE